MAHINIVCPFPNCQYSTGEQADSAVAVALLNAHSYSHALSVTRAPTQQPAPVSAAPRGPKLDRPKVDIGVTLEEWNLFKRKWTIFKDGSGILDGNAAHHLFQCAGESLGDALLKTDPTITGKGVEDVMKAMKTLAVIPIATGLMRSELMEMKQLRDEVFRKFAARVRGKAETCEYETSVACTACTEINVINFTDVILRDVLLAGIYDSDIRREMYGLDKVLEKTVNEVIAEVEKREMAREANSAGGSNSGISSMKQHQRRAQAAATSPGTPSLQNTSPHSKISDAERNKHADCPHCKKSFPLYRNGRFGWNAKPFKMCQSCFRRRKSGGDSSVSAVSDDMDSASLGVIVAQVSSIGQAINETTPGVPTWSRGRRKCWHRNYTKPVVNTVSAPCIKMKHHIFSAGEWRQSRFMDHPKIKVHMSVNHTDYASFSHPLPTLPEPVIDIEAKLDSCAQSCLWSLKDCLAAGFKEEALIPVSIGLSAANKSSIKISGAILARISTEYFGQTRSCATMVYVSPSCEGLYLSLEAMVDLNLINRNSPLAGAASVAATTVEPHPTMSSDEPCSCPERQAPPTRPDKLPFPATPENNERMENWLRERFVSSTFNTCPRQPLPEMSGPPVEIHLKEGAVPYKAHTAVSVPLHWKEQVKEGLLRDEKGLGVLERPPPDEDSKWCFREVYSGKPNGGVRRTVDYRPLNKWVKRDAFATESPFHIVRRIQGHTWKTVTDAWNGYHSVPLHPNSRHLTTFISMEGKFRYKRTPQGGNFAGDAYNRRHASITADFPRKETVVDDTCHYDDLDELEQHWWRTIDYLILCGQNGIILNPGKFQFARKTVDFAGFRVSESTIEPLPKYIDAIRDFPTPISVTDIRSWFGLINQLANYAQLRELMRPFKPFLSPQTPFNWTDELQSCFEASKTAIIDAIKEGVTIYDLGKGLASGLTGRNRVLDTT